MGATAAAPGLAALAESDERAVRSGFWDETVWRYEELRRALRSAVATLRR